MKAAILKLSKHNKEREVEFELNYLMSLTTKQRFQMVFKKNEEIFNLSPFYRRGKKKSGYRKITQVIKRT